MRLSLDSKDELCKGPLPDAESFPQAHIFPEGS